MAACPCWGDRVTAPGPKLTGGTCARRDTAAGTPAAAPTTTSSGVSAPVCRLAGGGAQLVALVTDCLHVVECFLATSLLVSSDLLLLVPERACWLRMMTWIRRGSRWTCGSVVSRVLAAVDRPHPVQLLLCVPPPSGQAASPAAAAAEGDQPAGLPRSRLLPLLHAGPQ